MRPEHLAIEETGGVWQGTVIHSENLGADSYVYVDVGAAKPVIIRQSGKSSYLSGQRLGFSPKQDSFHRFDTDGRALAH